MDEKQRLVGFKALLESHKTNSYDLAESDGSLRPWRDLSAEGRIETIARDAAWYDVPFEQFAQAVRGSVDNAAIEEAALRLAMRSGRESHDLENLSPAAGRTEPQPLVFTRAGEPLHAESAEHESEAVLDPVQQAALFKEIVADTEAGKREGAHRLGKEAFQNILDGKADAPAAEKGKDREMER